MKPVDQTTFAGKVDGAQTGNCMQAAMASLLELDLEEVPHFALAEGEMRWWYSMLDFLETKGFAILVCDGAPSRKSKGLVSGPSPRGDFWHTVVCEGEEIIHDPHPSREGLAGEEREYWFLVPFDPAL